LSPLVTRSDLGAWKHLKLVKKELERVV
jgi:hypothetical protein